MFWLLAAAARARSSQAISAGRVAAWWSSRWREAMGRLRAAKTVAARASASQRGQARATRVASLRTGEYGRRRFSVREDVREAGFRFFIGPAAEGDFERLPDFGVLEFDIAGGGRIGAQIEELPCVDSVFGGFGRGEDQLPVMGAHPAFFASLGGGVVL